MKTAKTLNTEGFFGQLYEFQSILKMSQLHLLIFHPGHQPGKPDGWAKKTREGDNDEEGSDVVKAEEVLHGTSVLGKTFECCTGR